MLTISQYQILSKTTTKKPKNRFLQLSGNSLHSLSFPSLGATFIHLYSPLWVTVRFLHRSKVQVTFQCHCSVPWHSLTLGSKTVSAKVYTMKALSVVSYGSADLAFQSCLLLTYNCFTKTWFLKLQLQWFCSCFSAGFPLPHILSFS